MRLVGWSEGLEEEEEDGMGRGRLCGIFMAGLDYIDDGCVLSMVGRLGTGIFSSPAFSDYMITLLDFRGMH